MYPEDLHIEVYERYIKQTAFPMLAFTSAIKKAVTKWDGGKKLIKKKKE